METRAKMNCPLCGREFATDRQGCSGGCPMGSHCNLVCCPHCHYSFPRDSRTVNFFKKILQKRKNDELQS